MQYMSLIAKATLACKIYRHARRCSVSLLPRVRHCGTAHSMPLTLKHIISGRGSWCRPTIDGLSEAVEDDVKNMQVDAVEEDKRGRLKEEVIAPLR